MNTHDINQTAAILLTDGRFLTAIAPDLSARRPWLERRFGSASFVRMCKFSSWNKMEQVGAND